METNSIHLLCEYHRCDADTLKDLAALERLMKRAAEAADATIVDCIFHRFSPNGVSGVVVIEESHLSIHTWPEHGYAAVDFFTCGDSQPRQAHRIIQEGLGSGHAEVMVVDRGQAGESAIRVRDHFQES